MNRTRTALNPPPVYKPDNSLRPIVLTPSSAGQPQNRPAAPAFPQCRPGIQMAPQRPSSPGGALQPGAFSSSRPFNAAPAFRSASHSGIATPGPGPVIPSHQTAHRPAVQTKSVVQQPWPAMVRLHAQGTGPGPMRVPGSIQRNLAAGGRFRATSFATLPPPIQMAMANLHRGRYGVTTSPVVIQPMLSWATEKLSSLGEWITGHPAPKDL